MILQLHHCQPKNPPFHLQSCWLLEELLIPTDLGMSRIHLLSSFRADPCILPHLKMVISQRWNLQSVIFCNTINIYIKSILSLSRSLSLSLYIYNYSHISHIYIIIYITLYIYNYIYNINCINMANQVWVLMLEGFHLRTISGSCFKIQTSLRA